MLIEHAATCRVIRARSPRIAKRLVDEKDELPGAVVLGYGIGAALVDAARDLAVGVLVRRVPTQVIGRHVRASEPHQRLGDHRAVANPRPRVGARARTQYRTVARHQQMRERGTQRVEHGLRGDGAP